MSKLKPKYLVNMHSCNSIGWTLDQYAMYGVPELDKDHTSVMLACGHRKLIYNRSSTWDFPYETQYCSECNDFACFARDPKKLKSTPNLEIIDFGSSPTERKNAYCNWREEIIKRLKVEMLEPSIDDQTMSIHDFLGLHISHLVKRAFDEGVKLGIKNHDILFGGYCDLLEDK